MVKYHGNVNGFRSHYRLYQFIGNDGMKSARTFAAMFGGRICLEETNKRKRDLFVEINSGTIKL